RRHRVAGAAGRARAVAPAAVRLPDRQAAGGGGRGRAGRQAERAVSGAAQPRRRGPAGQRGGAFGERSAAPLLPHHEIRPRGAARVDRRVERQPRQRRQGIAGRTVMNASSHPPRTIAEYLEQLRAALRGADPALIQDALYDAEEHLRAELYERPGRDEAAMLEHVVESYGAPDEVAEIYRDQEIRIQRAIRPPPVPKRRSAAGRFFGVIADPRA